MGVTRKSLLAKFGRYSYFLYKFSSIWIWIWICETPFKVIYS